MYYEHILYLNKSWWDDFYLGIVLKGLYEIKIIYSRNFQNFNYNMNTVQPQSPVYSSRNIADQFLDMSTFFAAKLPRFSKVYKSRKTAAKSHDDRTNSVFETKGGSRARPAHRVRDPLLDLGVVFVNFKCITYKYLN